MPKKKHECTCHPLSVIIENALDACASGKIEEAEKWIRRYEEKRAGQFETRIMVKSDKLKNILIDLINTKSLAASFLGEHR